MSVNINGISSFGNV